MANAFMGAATAIPSVSATSGVAVMSGHPAEVSLDSWIMTLHPAKIHTKRVKAIGMRWRCHRAREFGHDTVSINSGEQ